MHYSHWVIRVTNAQAEANLTQAGLSPLIARTLAARGISDPAAARAEYLSDDLGRLHDPMLMQGMDRACKRIRQALDSGETMAVYGDYDVDGITAVCLLVRYLRGEGADCRWYIPDRLEEGYGINTDALDKLKQQGVSLVITVDTGITATEQAQYARSIGLDMVITDHHECKQTLPEACAVVNPHCDGCEYPFKGLAGVGVAFKLACALAGQAKTKQVMERYSDLVALGTLADVMPVTGENRTVISQGLKRATKTKNIGLGKLIRQAGIKEKELSTTSVGFALAPRINAAGRMGRASLAVRLLLTDDKDEAEQLAGQLCRLNKDRQSVGAEIYENALAMLGDSPGQPAIVLAGENWHQGVVGIVASKLAEKFGRPVFMLSVDGEEARGSARGVEGVNLFEALSACAPLLLSFGGHELAAGFSLKTEKIAAFRRAIYEHVSGLEIKEKEAGTLQIDFVPRPEEMTLDSVADLRRLEPYGVGNEKPVVCLEDARIVSAVGICGGRHVKIKAQWCGLPIEAIFFGLEEDACVFTEEDQVDLAGTLEINEFRGFRTIQIIGMDIRHEEKIRRQYQEEMDLYERFSGGGELEPAQAGEMIPNRQEFVALWRYIKRKAGKAPLRESLSQITRKSVRGTDIPPSYIRTRLGLDVFSDCGLIRFSCRRGNVEIALEEGSDKVDLNLSQTLRRMISYTK